VLVPEYQLLVQAEYVRTVKHDQIGNLPVSSASIAAAFPERFERDASGTLVLFDARPLNFESETFDQYRHSLSFGVPLWRAPAANVALPAGASKPKLDVTLGHSILLRDRLVIRAGLAPIDLARQGEAGLGSSRPRHLVDGSIALTDRGSGIRLNGSIRSRTLLQTSLATGELLEFGSLARFDLRVFAEVSRFIPKARWAKQSRVTVLVQNLAGARQAVTDRLGATPLAYQSAYRDAVGRTVQIEFRKVF
jgi:hypothetical protein